nr:ATPase [Rhizobium sp. Q54]
MPVEWTKGEKRDVSRLLRRLLRGECCVEIAADGRLLIGEEGHPCPAVLVRQAEARGLVRRNGRRLSATDAAAAFLRRSLLADQEAFPAQHRLDMDAVVEVGGHRQTVRRNLAESPLSLLARLKDRAGGSYLPAEALDAGERLLSDFTRGQLRPRITASWEPRLAGRGKGQSGGQTEIADSALAARDRFSRAVEAMGPELAGVAIDVCCFEKGLETVERERQWPPRSAKLMLRTALLALARHYAPPPRDSLRSAHRWGAEGYRPML